MNSVLERVNTVCKNVRAAIVTPTSFKKLIGAVRREFKEADIDLVLKTKKDISLEKSGFYVMAYYDPDDDFNNETPIEVVVHHHFTDLDRFQLNQITDFLIQIFDAVVHEIRHQRQSRKRNHETFSEHIQEPYAAYLADPDELDAYAFSIAIEILRVMPKAKAKTYMTRMHILAKMRIGPLYVSTNLHAYVGHFKNNPLLKNLAKKIYKHIESIDRTHIFV
jgi:hypothetical protein